MKPLLALIQPRLTANGARVSLYLSTAGSGAPVDGQNWEAAITRRPRLTMDLFSPALDGKVQVGRGDMSLNLALIRQQDARALYWPGALVTIYDATDLLPLAQAPIEFTGFVRSAPRDLDTDSITLNMEVSTQQVEKPLLFAEFSGAGGVNGDADLRGTLKPAGFGTVKNVEPVWFDLARNIGMIDGYNNCTSITALFEGGNQWAAKVADYANYATLAAAIDNGTVPPGRWASCVNEGLVGIGAPPVQPITVDATFGFNRPGALIERLLLAHAGVSAGDVDAAAMDALDASVNRAVHYWTSSQRDVLDLIEAIAASCNASPIATFQGKYSVTRVFGGANVATVNRKAPAGEPRVTRWRWPAVT